MTELQINQEDAKTIKTIGNYVVGVLIFILVWFILGLIAFIWSIICFSSKRNGSTTANTIGILLAIFFGPFYFIYLGINKDYCRKKISSF